MKGIILAGGTGSRIFPITLGVNKHLLPVYDKPMIYYPISTLMLAGIREILIITRPEDIRLYKSLLGDGSQWGVHIEYAEQKEANGIAEAFLIGEKFIDGKPCALTLGDNIFFSHAFPSYLKKARENSRGATIFGLWVPDPERFGVANIDKNSNKVTGLEEKPANPKSNYAVPGLYFYDEKVCEIAKTIKPSGRGELEITDINKHYLAQDELNIIRLERGFSWFDAGLPDSLLAASQFIGGMSQRQGLKVACPEEIAWHNHWIDDNELESLANKMSKSEYGRYLSKVLSYGR